MTLHRLITPAIAAALGTLGLAACDLDVPDLNNPGLDTLQDQPDAVSIAKACTGLLIGNRSNIANEFGYVVDLGILGREAYNFDTADPRFIGELLAGELSKGSPFGGNFWGVPYANIRLANVILHALDKVSDQELSAANKQGVRGFVHTIMALDLLQVVVTHDTNGAVIDTDRDLTQGPGPIVSKDIANAKIVQLLDDATGELDAAEGTFPFLLSSGFAGFDTPLPPPPGPQVPTTSFRQFNRALRARVGAYIASTSTAKDYTAVLTALGESFIDDTAMGDFATGVYWSFSAKTGDTTNGLINPNIYVHPMVQIEANKKADNKPDDRYTAKVTTTKTVGSATGTPLMSNLVFTLYDSPSSPVALITNEELILIKAEALWYSGMKSQAIDELNIVRTRAGGLEPVAQTTDEATFVTELLYDRRYSLLFEGGHRWIDLRRFGRQTELPLDDPATHMRNMRFPIPLNECNARPGEQACTLGSL